MPAFPDCARQPASTCRYTGEARVRHQAVPSMEPNGSILDTSLLLALPLPWNVIPGKRSEVLSVSCFPGRLLQLTPGKQPGRGGSCQITARAQGTSEKEEPAQHLSPPWHWLGRVALPSGFGYFPLWCHHEMTHSRAELWVGRGLQVLADPGPCLDRPLLSACHGCAGRALSLAETIAAINNR